MQPVPESLRPFLELLVDAERQLKSDAVGWANIQHNVNPATPYLANDCEQARLNCNAVADRITTALKPYRPD